jgi:hypothetical protein
MKFEKVSQDTKYKRVADMLPGQFAKSTTGNNLLFVTKENHVVNLSSGSTWAYDKSSYTEVCVEIYEPGDQLLVTI